MYRQLMGLRQLSRRTITGSARRQLDNTVKEKQKVFQKPCDSCEPQEPSLMKNFLPDTWNDISEQRESDGYGESNITSAFNSKEDNGMPIHLKGGSQDAVLYRATMILTVFGSGCVVYELFRASMPKKPH